MDLDRERQSVAFALRKLEARLEEVVAALAHGDVVATVQDAARESVAVRRACEAYAGINYGMEDGVGASIRCFGAIGVTSDIMRKAKAVNAAKAELKALCVLLQRVRIRIPVKSVDAPNKAIPAIRVILRSIRRSDLNLLAAYRKIPLLDAPPLSITYTRAHTRAVYRKSVDELYTLMMNSESPVAARDRARLSALSRGETHLALVRERYQNIRANILYARLDPRGRGRIQVAAELPLLYVISRGIEHPVVQFPRSTDDDSNEPTRVRRSQLDPQPYLESLPVFRYAHA